MWSSGLHGRDQLTRATPRKLLDERRSPWTATPSPTLDHQTQLTSHSLAKPQASEAVRSPPVWMLSSFCPSGCQRSLAISTVLLSGIISPHNFFFFTLQPCWMYTGILEFLKWQSPETRLKFSLLQLICVPYFKFRSQNAAEFIIITFHLCIVCTQCTTRKFYVRILCDRHFKLTSIFEKQCILCYLVEQASLLQTFCLKNRTFLSGDCQADKILSIQTHT